MTTKKYKTYLVCYGTPSPRCVIVGESKTPPVIGETLTLYNVRMVLYWAGEGGLHGLIANGPHPDSRITAPAPSYSVVVAEWGELSDVAAAVLEEHPAC